MVSSLLAGNRFPSLINELMPEELPQAKTPTSKNPAGFTEWRSVSFRNRGRLQIGTGADFTSEYPAGINRIRSVRRVQGRFDAVLQFSSEDSAADPQTR
jgi:hypothetical protein